SVSDNVALESAPGDLYPELAAEQVVPEPSTLSMALTALTTVAVLCGIRRTRRADANGSGCRKRVRLTQTCQADANGSGWRKRVGRRNGVRPHWAGAGTERGQSPLTGRIVLSKGLLFGESLMIKSFMLIAACVAMLADPGAGRASQVTYTFS